MKLTKEVIKVLKYHGYMTSTVSAEDFVRVYKTVEDLGAAGYIGDRGAIAFLKTLFDENGVNRSAEVGETELEKQAVEEPIVDTPETPETPDPIVEPEPENGPAPEPETPAEDPAEEPASETVAEPEPEKEPEPTPEPEAPAEDPKPKTKKTTTKKSTKKES